MLIVLFRHGIAEDKDGGKPDEQRRLTREGHREVKRVARSLAKLLPDAGAIYSSPLIRAWETAEWVAKAYDRSMDIETTPVLAPGSDSGELRGLLRRATVECAYFVGHEPHLTSLMLALTDMRTGGELSLKKAGCYGLTLEDADATARLRWMLAPAVMG
jgi:phosphohistidine phosphatase